MTLQNERIHELLAEAALGGLTPDEQRELDIALSGPIEQDAELQALEFALANASIALAEPDIAPPAQFAQQLIEQGTSLIDPDGDRRAPAAIAAAPVLVPDVPAPPPAPSLTVISSIGWLAAAACLVFALVGWLRTPTTPGPMTPEEVASAREVFLQTPDVITVAWQPWNGTADAPAQTDVTGDVVWSDERQQGYMRFKGLKTNDPKQCQYQLWIIDEGRGMEQRISGGVFDSPCGDFIIEFDPAEIPVNKAVAFAITVEKPGGTWVSDMAEPIVIASR